MEIFSNQNPKNESRGKCILFSSELDRVFARVVLPEQGHPEIREILFTLFSYPQQTQVCSHQDHKLQILSFHKEDVLLSPEFLTPLFS